VANYLTLYRDTQQNMYVQEWLLVVARQLLQMFVYHQAGNQLLSSTQRLGSLGQMTLVANYLTLYKDTQHDR
jgi:hypothetical protein